MRALLALFLAGCAGNAVLELEVVLPAADACGVALGLEARISTACLFEQDWFDGDAAVLAIEEGVTAHQISLVAEGADVDRTLCLRARGCPDASACPLADVTAGRATNVEIPRAFYRGHYTRYSLLIDPCVAQTLTIDRCDIEGCAELPRETYCADGRHLCE